jgi:hypothetical protein
LTLETTPMSRADWRAPGAYEELRSLDAPGFAWEYRSSSTIRTRRSMEWRTEATANAVTR